MEMVASRRVVFVTTELFPETGGGAGVAVDALARGLGAEGEVLVVLATAEPVEIVPRAGVEVATVSIPATGFMERSRVAGESAAAMIRPGDRIEVQDFEGLGYWLLVHRIRLGLELNPVTVRFHGPYDLLRRAMDTAPPDWDLPAAMERAVFRMADQVLIPVEGHRPALVERFRVEPDRIGVSPPPVPPVEGTPLPPGEVPVFAAVGRLGEMKGTQDLVDASLLLLEAGARMEIRLLGGDGWSPTAQTSMTDWLRARIPEAHRPAFHFAGPFPRERLPRLLDGVWAVVAPSRFESFSLAVHEARRLGLPLILPELPAFTGLFHEGTGARLYDGSVPGLAQAMRELAEDRGLRDALASAPLPDPGDTWGTYRSDPSPHHPRAQAGLATEGSQMVEQATAPEPDAGSPLLRGLYRRIPPPLAAVAARLTPTWIKDRLRPRASWPVEHALQRRDRRLRAVERRIRAGEFPEHDSPAVTVVIPVHNDVEFLEETLASVYEQTFDSWEIVVVDDGSSLPAAVAFLDRLDRPRLRVLRKPHTGLPGARNAGMGIARGGLLVPLDSDDELEPAFLDRLVPALRAHPRAGYAHCLARLHGDIDAIWVPRPFNPYWQLLENGVVGCVLLRASAWEEVGGYDETMTSGNEDWELWLRLLGSGWDQVRVEEVLFRYRKHGVSMSVATEARFEEGRRMVRDRHPDLYRRPALAARKQRWYPRLTLIGVAPPAPLADAEVVSGRDRLLDTWGKYVVDLSGVDPIPTSLLDQMADRLEREPRAARARTTGDPPLMMTRRWVVHDPEAEPDQTIVVDDPTPGPGSPPLDPGSWPRAGWVIPPEVREAGVPVQRRPPEEAGDLPDPVAW